MKRPHVRLTRRRLLAMAIDVAIVGVAYYVALSFRFAGQIPVAYSWHGGSFVAVVALAGAFQITANWGLRVYTIVNRYVGLGQARHLVRAGSLATAGVFFVVLVWPSGQRLLPLSVVVFGGLLATVCMVGVRFYGRIFHERSLSNVEPERHLLLVGAGQAADLLVREVQRNHQLRTRVVGLVDDDPRLQGMRLHTHPVLGTVDDIPRLVDEHGVSEILIAIPSATPTQLARIHEATRDTGIPVKTLPTLTQLVDGVACLADARELRIEDLLGRPKVAADLAAIAGYLAGRRVLITGAGGSIGSELSRQIAAFGPGSLLLVDRDESALYHLHEDLKARGDAATYTLIPTDILQWAKMERLFREHRPEVVFHAAAFKHVPLMELHPDEAVLNNVKGTRIVAGLAGRYGAERVINISTDKAVDPVNVMGATKRATERLLQRLASRHPRTRYCSVRFGNVLGSRGSVVPIFQQQIANGGPVTITHPDMTRYLMMIEEAVQLVLQAAALAEEVPEERWCDLPDPLAGCGTHGVFVLEMGRPVNIVDLATQMIGLLYHDTERAIALEVTGIRPGERLHEQLFCHDEESVPTSHPMVHLARARPGNGSVLPADFDHRLGELLRVAERHAEPQEIIEALAACVPGYDPFDWTQVGIFPGAADYAAGLGAAAPAGVPAAEAMPEAATGAVSAPVGQVADVAPPGMPRTAAPAGRTARPDPAFAPTRA